MIADAADTGSTEVICQFCNAAYYLATAQLESLRETALGNAA
jgi:hypothetical protein